MDAGSVGGRLVEEGEGAGEGVVWVLDAEGGGGDFLEVWFDEDGCSVGLAGKAGVARVGYEGDLSGTGFFNAAHASDFDFRIAAEFSSEGGCEFAELH